MRAFFLLPFCLFRLFHAHPPTIVLCAVMKKPSFDSTRTSSLSERSLLDSPGGGAPSRRPLAAAAAARAANSPTNSPNRRRSGINENQFESFIAPHVGAVSHLLDLPPAPLPFEVRD